MLDVGGNGEGAVMAGAYVATPAAIVGEGKRLGAERICFWDGSYYFTELDVSEVEALLPRMLAGRFKFQAMSAGRWKDLGRYRHVVDSRLLRELERQTFADEPDFVPAELRAVVSAQPSKFHGALRRLLYDTIERQLLRPVRGGLQAVVEYFSQFEDEWCEDDHFQFFLTYFRVFDRASEHGLAALIKDPQPQAVAELALLLRDALGGAALPVGAEAAARCVIGQVWSLTDRRAAAEEFRPLRAGRGAELIRHFYWDSGALTYYDTDELGTAAEADAGSMVASIEPIRVAEPRASTGVGVSVDPTFFRIYGAWLYFYAQQLPDVDFNVFLCASEEDAEQLVADGDHFVEALSRLNLAARPSNVNLYRMPTPTHVGRATTFYACARFFAASVLLERYSNIYLMDVDLYPADNPMAFFESLEATVLAAPRTETCIAVSPWRRHMAGNVPMNRDIHSTALLEQLQTYIAHGLRNGGDWMLDQNALAYVAESDAVSSGVYESLNAYKRPFFGTRFMATWEANFKRTRQRA